MKIYEFIDKFCPDIVKAAHDRRKLIDFQDYPYDEIIEDSKGVAVPVVYIDGVAVPVMEFFTTSREDFVKLYKMQSAGEAYDNYIRNFEILEGEEALSKVRMAMQAESERLQRSLSMDANPDLELV